MSGKYVLDGHTPVPCHNLAEWGKSMARDRAVAQDRIGEVRVSTVFLGLDHNFGDGPPLLFETMVFGGAHDQDCDRYSTWDAAVAGHAAMLAKVKGS